MRAAKCFISRAINGDFLAQEQREMILNNLKEVPTRKNAILDEIMRNQANWLANPTIIVDGAIYKLVLIELSIYQVTMYQNLIRMNTNGRKGYTVLSRRKVQIYFE